MKTIFTGDCEKEDKLTDASDSEREEMPLNLSLKGRRSSEIWSPWSICQERHANVITACHQSQELKIRPILQLKDNSSPPQPPSSTTIVNNPQVNCSQQSERSFQVG